MASYSAAANVAVEYASTRSKLEQQLDADPGAARTEAEGLLAAAPTQPDLHALAWRIAGTADRQLGELVRAQRRLERAIGVEGTTDQERAMAEAALVAVLLLTGRFDEAWDVSERALPALGARAAARLRLSRAAILSQQADQSGALRETRSAFKAFQELGDRAGLTRALNNRAIVRAATGHYRAAIRDLERAVSAEKNGDPGRLAIAHHNLGLMVATSGEVPRGLRLLDEADRTLEALELPHPEGHLDHARLLLEVGLLPEALTQAEKGRTELEARGWDSDLPDAHHLLARIALASANGAVARAEVDAEVALLQHQNRPTEAAVALGQVADELTAEAGEVPDRPALEHLPTDLLLRRARTLHAEHPEQARDALSEIVGRGDRSSWRARTEELVARAELEFMAGNEAQTRVALAAIFAELGENSWWLGIGEICAAALRSLDSVVDLSGRLALAAGEPDDLVRGHENARQLNRSAPAVDRGAMALASRARGLSSRLSEPDLSDRQRADLLRRVRSTRAQLRRRSWGRAAEPGRTLRALEPREIARTFDRGAGLIVSEIDGQIVACVLAANRITLRLLTFSDALLKHRRALNGAHLALLHGRQGAEDRFAAIVSELDRQLLSGLVDLLPSEGPIVLAVADELLSLPWGSLASVEGRAISLVPSLSWWCHVERNGHQPANQRVVLVAGPDLAHAETEVELLRSRHHPDAEVLLGSEATAAQVLEAAAGAGTLHIAAHGRFRDDSPMFSSIELADGPVSIFELGQVSDPPGRLILSTCDLGRHGTTPMARASGLVHLLASGWESVAASTSPVLDNRAPQTMDRLHGLLGRAGIPGAVATLNAELPLGQASLVAFGH